MNIQILPHWYKRLGLVLFIIFSILGGIDDFRDGWNSVDCTLEEPNNKGVEDGFSSRVTYESSNLFGKYVYERKSDFWHFQVLHCF